MRVLVAPDGFGGTLTALQAAEAITTGWRRGAPQDEVDKAPLSDGGPGFLDVLAPLLQARRLEVTVRDPLLRPVRAHLLLDGSTAYVESAQACGLQLVASSMRRPDMQSTAGVGDLLDAAIAGGGRTVVVGLGGSATNDGGAGMLDARGVGMRGAGGGALTPLPRYLGLLDHLELRPDWRPDVELVAATDVDNPLLGPDGATTVYGPQKGVAPAELDVFESALRRLAEVVAREVPGAAGMELLPGAGAAGGLGYGLFVLGGRRESGIELVLGKARLSERIAEADLVVTGEGSFDGQSARGKVVAGVARLARDSGTRCIVLAGRVAHLSGELDAYGISAAYSVSEAAGSVEASLAEPARHVAALSEAVSRLGSS
jgi:glycerate kinase